MTARSPYQILRSASRNQTRPIALPEVTQWLSCLLPVAFPERKLFGGNIVVEEKWLNNLDWVPKVAVGVSGGADSMLLAYLLHQVLGPSKVQAFVVDHALRSESAREAELTLERLDKLGIEATRLNINWSNPEEETDSYHLNSNTDYSKVMDYYPGLKFPEESRLEQAARAARYGALLKALWHTKSSVLSVGHHWNDATETGLYRFARESGISGLPGLHPLRIIPQGVAPSGGWDGYEKRSSSYLFRPMLLVPKQRIYDTARYYGVEWVEDPTNQITTSKHQRTVIRSAMATWEASDNPELVPLQQPSLENWVNHMNSHAQIIQNRVMEALSKDVVFHYQFGMCELHLPPKPDIDHWFRNKYLAVRVLMTISRWISCSEFAPRLTHVMMVWEAMSGKPSPLYSSKKDGQFCLQLGKALMISPTKKTPYWSAVYSSFSISDKCKQTHRIDALIPDPTPSESQENSVEGDHLKLLSPMKPAPIFKQFWGNRFHVSVQAKRDFRQDPALLHWAQFFLPTLKCLPIGDGLCEILLLPVCQTTITQLRHISTIHRTKLLPSLQKPLKHLNRNLMAMQSKLTIESVRAGLPCVVLRIHTSNLTSFSDLPTVQLRASYVDVPLGFPTFNETTLFPYLFSIDSTSAFPTLDMLFPGSFKIPRHLQ